MEKGSKFLSAQESSHYRTGEAAVRLRVSERTLEKWRVQGAGPAFLKIGRLVFYTEEAIEGWLKSRSRKSTSDEGAEK